MFSQEDQEFINKQDLGGTVEPQEESWTSVDAYYRGFHIKKSWGKNVSRVILMAEIDDLVKAGFTPSWNQETNKAMAPASVTAPTSHKPVERQYGDEDVMCPLHNVLMTQKEGKFGTFWSHKKPDGVWCNGRKTAYNK